MSVASFDHIGLSVADLERQCRFYAEAFGFCETHRTEIPDAGVRIALLSGPSGAAVEFTQRVDSAAQHFANPLEGAGIQGYFHWALTVPDLDAALAAAVAHGARTVSQPAPARRPGIRFAYVADPEGNLIELLQHTH
ncbi:VOC family protein [Streptomyces cocklensis]|jgi:catechol 2,3-dioxygenase-like lactoylglutathione lyase family enzyme|uniref:Glyoxalase n=1 Tax=Actinacidiphila cocklensis TaxID=887465 RepID=A0A9W4EAB6_9ACTN|nr:VOC family protein [Actinacidiphila cocklensis]MDD1059828.1 VOC family protein [Actinacidiphila cocklensis]WSX72697.1 VOC family protein [Streptomyces sp. NBC_00899]WSX81235.1 VOC family protein [Streptomyces sp. NBC_00899]CAG6397111.1 Glyoxalase [Actinacidiphila cocklensis]